MKTFKNLKIAKNTWKNNFFFFKTYFYNYWLTYFPSHTLRCWYLRKFLKVKIGKDSFIHLGCYFNGNNISIGNNTVIGRSCDIVGEVQIGDNCSISAYTILQSVSHDKNSPTFAGIHNPIKIDDYVWIGFRSIILPGTIIGKGAIIGANSTVVPDSGGGGLPPCSVFAGSPAKLVSKRSPEALRYILNYKPMFN